MQVEAQPNKFENPDIGPTQNEKKKPCPTQNMPNPNQEKAPPCCDPSTAVAGSESKDQARP